MFLSTLPVHLPHATEVFGVEVLHNIAELTLQVKHSVFDYSSKHVPHVTEVFGVEVLDGSQLTCQVLPLLWPMRVAEL